MDFNQSTFNYLFKFIEKRVRKNKNNPDEEIFSYIVDSNIDYNILDRIRVRRTNIS